MGKTQQETVKFTDKMKLNDDNFVIETSSQESKPQPFTHLQNTSEKLLAKS